MQLDMFGATEESAVSLTSPPMLSGNGAWGTPDAAVFTAALQRGSLRDSIASLNRLQFKDVQTVLLNTGFEVFAADNRAQMIAGVQAQLVAAAQARTDGWGIRDSQQIATDLSLTAQYEDSPVYPTATQEAVLPTVEPPLAVVQPVVEADIVGVLTTAAKQALEPAALVPVTPEIVDNMRPGTRFVDAQGREYQAFSARAAYLEAYPVLSNGKAEIFAGNSIYFHLNPATAVAYPSRRHDPIYLKNEVVVDKTNEQEYITPIENAINSPTEIRNQNDRITRTQDDVSARGDGEDRVIGDNRNIHSESLDAGVAETGAGNADRRVVSEVPGGSDEPGEGRSGRGGAFAGVVESGNPAVERDSGVATAPAADYSTVELPKAVSDAISAAMQGQESRASRFSAEARADGIDLNLKLVLQKRRDAALAVLRKMRLSQFSVEDAAIRTIKFGNASDFDAHKALFPDVYAAVIGQMAMVQQPVPTPELSASQSSWGAFVAQAQALKIQNPDSLVLHKAGDFYELLDEDAVIAADVLGLRLTQRSQSNEVPVQMVGFPVFELEKMLRKLVESGKSVAVSEADAAIGIYSGSQRNIVRVESAVASVANSVDGSLPGVDGGEGEQSTARNSTAVDYVLTDEDRIGLGGLAEKFQDNIKAIELLRTLDVEKRHAVGSELRDLARYVGWGGLKGVFDPQNKQWNKQHLALKALLTDAEWAAASRSQLDAFYTAPVVAKAMYAGVTRMGFQSGRTLEPSVGNGAFFGFMPPAMRENSSLHAVEQDILTSRIVAALYPSAKVAQATGFQDYKVPAGYFDMVIGNPPFGSQAVRDELGSAYSGWSVHNYFFAKSIEMLRPGGIMPMVVSHNFLDKLDPHVRQWIARRAELVSGVRLPNTAFKENANTEVVTDVLIFRRLDNENTLGEQATPDWLQTSDVKIENPKTGESESVAINNYFLNNPGNVLGTNSATGSMYRANDYTVLPNGDLESQLAAWVETLPQGIYVPLERPRLSVTEAATALIPEFVKEGSFFVQGNEVWVRKPDLMGEQRADKWEAPNQRALERMVGMIEIRDVLRSQMRLERSMDAIDASVEDGRQTLNKVYDAFQSKNGFLNDPINRRLFLDDTESALIQALEFDYEKALTPAKALEFGTEPRPAKCVKADIFSRRVLFPPVEVEVVETAKDALLHSLNLKGRVDMAYMESAYDKNSDEIVRELGDLLFSDPVLGLVTADEYLSGDVKTKLVEAEKAFESLPSLSRNVEALKAVIPVDKLPSEIHAAIGAAWIPAEIFKDFAKEISGAAANFSYVRATGQWLRTTNVGLDFVKNNSEFGTDKMGALEIMSQTMNSRGLEVKKKISVDGRDVYVTDETATEAVRQKGDKVRAHWDAWLWSDPARTDQLTSIYNDRFNRTVERKYDGSHLTFPGMNPGMSLLAHQKNGVWRGLQDRVMLMDQVVGAGKAQPLDAKVLTPSGWRLMGELAVGDFIVTADGTATTVEAVFPQGEKEIFRVEFSDGSATECCSEHLWLTQTYRERGYSQRAKKIGRACDIALAKVRPLSDIRLDLVASHLNAKNHSIPIVAPVQFFAQAIPIKPYLMGVLLGDGGFTGDGVNISSADNGIIERCRADLPSNLKLGALKTKNRCPAWSITNVDFNPNWSNPLKDALDTLALRGLHSHEKFIPDCYLYNTVAVRIEILRGLMDTDGSTRRHSSYFYTSSDRLANGVISLVQSLGGIVNRSVKNPSYVYKGVKKSGRLCHVLCIKMPAHINPFHLERKAKAVVPKTKYTPTRFIVAVTSVGKKPAQCIRVAHHSRLYVTDDYVVTHNTYEGVAMMMEMRRLGITKKPLIAVPNHLTLQWRSEFYKLYPGANVLAATPQDFDKDNRERFFSKIVTGNWDAVVIGHSSLKKIAVPLEAESKIIKEQFDDISDAIEDMKRERGDRHVIRDMERIKLNLKAKLDKLKEKGGVKDNVVDFGDLGVDALFVDEMHEFKNLAFTTQMNRVAGLGNPAGSGKAFDLFVKIRYLQETFGDKAPLITATGTPISNSLAEMYTMQRYMQYGKLKSDGLHVFDAWAKQYGDVQNVYEVAPSGSGYRLSQRFAKFKNLPSLMGAYRGFADVITLDDLKAQEQALGKVFPVPKLVGGRPLNVVASRSDLQEKFFGVPEIVRNDDGEIKFELDLNTPFEIVQGVDGKFSRISEIDGYKRTSLPYETKQEAEYLTALAATTPVMTVDKNSIVGQFENLRELTRATNGKINALSLTGLANKAGLDYRLIDPGAVDFPDSKVNIAVRNMLVTANKWKADRGTQLVFCDLSVPLSAKAKMASKEKRVYVRDSNGELTHKKGTLHSVKGFEGLPYFLVAVGKGNDKSFTMFDSVSGVLIKDGFDGKQEAHSFATNFVAKEGGQDRWLAEREKFDAISPDDVDDYKNEKSLDVDGDAADLEISMQDIEGSAGVAGFSIYDDMKAKLVAGGIPAHEIEFIHDHDTPQAKDLLFKRVNAGDVRFLFGSTPKMGAGTNVQQLLVGLHHIDAPWRPSDLEQREGRIIRRGNLLYERDPVGFEVNVNRYATAQTYDTRRWQLLEHKAAGLEQLRNYDGSNEIDDVANEASNSADMKAAASGNPLILKETQLSTVVKKLRLLERSHRDQDYMVRSRVNSLRNFAEVSGPRELAGLKELQAQRDSADVLAVYAGQSLAEHKDVVVAMARIDKAISESVIPQSIVYHGMSFSFKRDFIDGHVSMSFPDGELARMENLSPSGAVTRMQKWSRGIDLRISHIDNRILNNGAEAARLSNLRGGSFPEANALAEAISEHGKVQRALMKSNSLAAVKPHEQAEFDRAVAGQKAVLRDLGLAQAVKDIESESSELEVLSAPLVTALGQDAVGVAAAAAQGVQAAAGEVVSDGVVVGVLPGGNGARFSLDDALPKVSAVPGKAGVDERGIPVFPNGLPVLPPHIAQRLDALLQPAIDAAAALESARKTDAMFQGGGRYGAEVLEKHSARLESMNANITKALESMPSVPHRVVAHTHIMSKMPNLELSQDEAVFFRKGVKATAPAPAGRDMESYIKVAADSISELRKTDVYRVLVESNRPEFMEAIAVYIKANRNDLVAEVDDVLDEARAEFRKSAGIDAIAGDKALQSVQDVAPVAIEPAMVVWNGKQISQEEAALGLETFKAMAADTEKTIGELQRSKQAGDSDRLVRMYEKLADRVALVDKMQAAIDAGMSDSPAAPDLLGVKQGGRAPDKGVVAGGMIGKRPGQNDSFSIVSWSGDRHQHENNLAVNERNPEKAMEVARKKLALDASMSLSMPTLARWYYRPSHAFGDEIALVDLLPVRAPVQDAVQALSSAATVDAQPLKHTLYGRSFSVVGEFEDSDLGTDEANAFMEKNPGTGVLEVVDGRVILASNSDKGIPLSKMASKQVDTNEVEDAELKVAPVAAAAVVPHDDWAGNLMKTRQYAKDLIEAGQLDQDAASALWGNQDGALVNLVQAAINKDAPGPVLASVAGNDVDVYPFGRTNDEDRFHGSRVRVLPNLKGDVAWEGTVQLTINGGRLLSVQRDDRENSSVRILGNRIEVLSVKDKDAPEPTLATGPDMDHLKTRMVEDIGFDVPAGSIIMNAPRPLAGADTRTGNFVAGVHYSIISPDDPMAQTYIAENTELDARLVVLASKDLQMSLAIKGSKYIDAFMKTPEDKRYEKTSGLRRDMMDMPYGELKVKIAAVEADAPVRAAGPDAASPTPALASVAPVPAAGPNVDHLKTRMVEDIGFDVPAGSIVMNAPRPLLGTTKATGEFLTGRHYAIISSDDSMAATYIAENVKMDARLLVVASKDVQMSVALDGNEYRDQYMELDADERYQRLSSSLEKFRDMPFGELKLKMAQSAEKSIIKPMIEQVSSPAVVVDGMFTGPVMSIADGLAVQRVNRAGDTVLHDVSKLSAPVKAGDFLDVRYQNGRGEVSLKWKSAEVGR